ncbi:MAG: phenylalanine--tRNA ligase subunit alpha, partial [Proteobacteria bacterium]|nr:phenylalanine--tRNA ligase subunit alpha [Pseudomonadota bacterium]
MSSQDLSGIETELLGEISGAADLAAIEHVRISALGKKGRVAELMGRLGKMPPEERKAFGATVNKLKDRVTAALEERKATLEAAAMTAKLAAEQADVTLPVRSGPVADGRIHPISQVFDEIAEIFADMGFAIAE